VEPTRQRPLKPAGEATTLPGEGKPLPRSAADFLPPDRGLGHLREAAAGCEGCDLHENATQTVFGEGPGDARILIVGEQPGDQEDIQGHPFVGSAGRVLDRALEAAGIPRDQTFVTNAVKHFKWEPKGKRRIHATPRASEIRACRPWLEAEIEAVEPDLIVCLGATAAKSVFGAGFRVTQARGQLLESPLGPPAVATVHPSSILRAQDDASRRDAYEAFLADMRVAADFLRQESTR
jgi:uracil-DNA glycosylase